MLTKQAAAIDSPWVLFVLWQTEGMETVKFSYCAVTVVIVGCWYFEGIWVECTL